MRRPPVETIRQRWCFCTACESIPSVFAVQRRIVKSFFYGEDYVLGYTSPKWARDVENYREFLAITLGLTLSDTEIENQVLWPMALRLKDDRLWKMADRTKLWAAIAKPYVEGVTIARLRESLGLSRYEDLTFSVRYENLTLSARKAEPVVEDKPPRRKFSFEEA